MGRRQEKKRHVFTGIFLSLFTLSAMTFLFETILTRLFAIAHFYHFAFMVISLALLGVGASGSFLSVIRPVRPRNIQHWLALMCAVCGLSILGAYLLFNQLPFDAYAVMIEPRQVLLFILQLLALSMPFFFTGLCVNVLMKTFPEISHRTYAFNLTGSALGCLLAPLLLPALSGEGVVLLCCAMIALCALFLIFINALHENDLRQNLNFRSILVIIVCAVIIVIALPEIIHRAEDGKGNTLFNLYLSPYKSLSYALQYPGAVISETSWNAFSRIDEVRSDGIRSLPGLSYQYPELVKAEKGLFIDGDNLSVVLPDDLDADLFSHLPQSLVYRLRPGASVLVIQPRGGLDLYTAQAGGALSITAVESNSLLVSAAGDVYRKAGTSLVIESPRSFLAQEDEDYDIIIYSLTSSYYPVSSGAFSLNEDYIFTVESFSSALDRLKPDGVIVLNNWLQVPPSEFLRAFILAVEALEESGLEADQRIAALRGYNLGTLFLSKSPFADEELDQIRSFAESRAFDLVYLPGMKTGENNRFNILPEDEYALTFKGYLDAGDRKEWLEAYPYKVSPPTDDQPFIKHYFKWSQTNQVLASLGSTWQPFGGAGYLMIIFIFVIVLVICLLLIIVPVLVQYIRSRNKKDKEGYSSSRLPALAYFTLIGLGFMAIEIPIMQKFILLLGQPTYSFSVVLFTILLASGVGSLCSKRINDKGLLILGLWASTSLLWLDYFVQLAVGWPLIGRFAAVLISLAPPGILMGIALPKGIQKIEEKDAVLIPWLWAVNGASSVSASVLCAMLTISFGFTPLLMVGGICYLAAFKLFKKL